MRRRLRPPEWTQSIRFRMSLLYSSLLFGAGALVVGVIYLSLWLVLERQPVYQQLLLSPTYAIRDGQIVTLAQLTMTEVESLERLVNEQTLARLSVYSFAALGALFIASLLIGWIVSGRALRPIHRVTEVAQDIQATDLSRRIDLQGPNDELRRLADTFDEMLDRLALGFDRQREFIADVSHDLRNPLAVIQTNVELTLDDPRTDVAEWRRTGEIVRDAAGRMFDLVEELLATARQRHRQLAQENVDLSHLVATVVGESKLAAAARSVRLETVKAGEVTVLGNQSALHRALANLVENAVRLAPRNSTIGTGTGIEGRWAWLAVADQGPGIEAEHLEHLFERFYQIEPSSRSQSHLGLGLAIVKEVAEAHGGTARVVSRVGVGSTFTIWLPLDPDPYTPPPPALHRL
ncbi:MAG: HAMP domain-containing histidine kinase [Acidimicrobiia bacterium]|nr:HAMP domain-containing histidine kinase [Acidimicrobiia bacterium]MDH3425343.1 HAMP domain-containing histidine kinase [Acidimicrobiia bacterium]MDH5616104.1 HAMP domain-containing histidine kinase [Acidimicrobiia bacterium]